MIKLFTGTVGIGKTSIVLKELSFIKNRPKYATPVNASDFSFANHGFMPLPALADWQDLPSRSVIFCDDADNYLPDFDFDHKGEYAWVVDLALHRHNALDIYLTAINHTLITEYLRPLISQHTHLTPHHDGTICAKTWPYCVSFPEMPNSDSDLRISYLDLKDYF